MTGRRALLVRPLLVAVLALTGCTSAPAVVTPTTESGVALEALPRTTNTGYPLGGWPSSRRASLAQSAAVLEARVTGLTTSPTGQVRGELEVLRTLSGAAPDQPVRVQLHARVDTAASTVTAAWGVALPFPGSHVVLVLDRSGDELWVQAGCGVYTVTDAGTLEPQPENPFADAVRGLPVDRLVTG